MTTPNAPYFERTVPAQPWTILALAAGVIVLALALGWERYCRNLGYEPGLDDTPDLWVEARRSVQPDSIVAIGSSRILFNLDLDELEKGLGKRPVQLALVGSCVAPMLQHLAQDPTFHGTVLCDIVPALATVPPMAPPYHNTTKALDRLKNQSVAQQWGHHLSLPLEQTFACLQQEDLTLAALLKQVRIPNRPAAQVGPALPPYFSTIDRDRRTRMLDRVQTDQALQDRVKFGWLPLFTPPPKPHWIPDAAFGEYMHGMLEGRFKDFADAVAAIQKRGGKVVFVHFPSSGELRSLEERLIPRPAVWDRLLKDTGAPGIAFEDHADLKDFTCPEWSHLSATDSVEFSKRLVPHLTAALKTP